MPTHLLPVLLGEIHQGIRVLKIVCSPAQDSPAVDPHFIAFSATTIEHCSAISAAYAGLRANAGTLTRATDEDSMQLSHALAQRCRTADVP